MKLRTNKLYKNLLTPRKNNFDYFKNDKFNCVEAFKFNEEDKLIGHYFCGCYDF